MSIDLASAVLMAALEDTGLDTAEINFLKRCQPAGITLFKRNVGSDLSQLKTLSSGIQSLIGQSRLGILAIDQEGGRVSRLAHPFPNLGPALSLGAGQEESILLKIKNYGRVVGACLKELGVNVNFAPVCDIHSRPANTSIGDRAFGTTAETARLGAEAFLDGQQQSGVLGCLKHFPGQGDAHHDTHQSQTEIDLSLDELLARELIPFAQLIPQAEMIMMSHACYPMIDLAPASLSSVIMQSLLRERLGFSGIIVTDDMNMKAIPQDLESWGDSLVEAVAQGADLVLVCKGLDRCEWAWQRLAKEASSSKAFAVRLSDAAQRVNRLRDNLKF